MRALHVNYARLMLLTYELVLRQVLSLNLLFLRMDTHVNYRRTIFKLHTLNAFYVQTCTMASTKFAFFENRGILG